MQEDNGTAESASETTGTLDEIKDFMFVVTDDAGVGYAFTLKKAGRLGISESWR